MKKWLAGWISRIGGNLVRFADWLYPPYPLRRARPADWLDAVALAVVRRILLIGVGRDS